MNPLVFKAYDIRGVAERDFPSDEVRLLGRALGSYFLKRGERTVVVGRDNRRHSPRLREALVQGLLQTGCDVVDIGQTVTPVFYFTHFHFGLRAGVMVTASHNPPEDNGFKVFCGESTIHGEEIQEVRRLVEGGAFPSGEGTAKSVYPEKAYVEYISSRIRPAGRLKVALDAGSGAAGPLAVTLFSTLGCEVIPLYCEPDPDFPYHHPDPTVPANLADLRTLVLSVRADIGLSFDGDGDRLGVVDEKGNILWGDMLQILFWREILPRYPGATGIVEVKCSQALPEEIERLGGWPLFYKTGHSLIKAKMRELGAPFTGEMSGHFFFADEYFGYDDALYAGARLIRILAQSDLALSELLRGVCPYHATPETRIPCPEVEKSRIVAGVIDSFRRQGYEVIDVDGARVKFPEGWALVRASNTQPVLVARCEASSEQALANIKRLMDGVLSEFPIGKYSWEPTV